MRRILAVLVLLLPAPAFAQTVSKHIGSVTVMADHSLAFPGGLFVVHLSSGRWWPGSAVAILDGRRCPFFPVRHGLRALVPIPATFAPGPATLGVDIRARRRSRIPMDVIVAPRDYAPRTVVIPASKRELVMHPSAIRDGRQILLQLRTESPTQLWQGPFRPPVSGEPFHSYGAPTIYEGGSPVEATTDSIFGEYHRGMDYAVPEGTVVQAPAAGMVILAGYMPLTGYTLVLDHGQGLLSVFFHLGRLDAYAGQTVEGRSPIALSGDSGIAALPHVHWGVYLHGVAIDPRVMERVVD